LDRNSLFVWTMKAHFRHRRQWPQRFARFPDLTVVRLKTPAEIECWLSTL
jgi:hypothetical protein